MNIKSIEGLVAIHQETRGAVLVRHLSAIADIDRRYVEVVTELDTCPLGKTRGLIQKLWDIVDEELERDLNGLKAARELVILGGRFRRSLPPANIY